MHSVVKNHVGKLDLVAMWGREMLWCTPGSAGLIPFPSFSIDITPAAMSSSPLS